MVEFDEVAYNAASNLFHEARRIRRSLPSLIAQVSDALDMLQAQSYDERTSGGGDNRVERKTIQAIADNDALLEKLHADQEHYREVALMCETAIADMESHLEGDALDSNMLRYYYMQDMSIPAVSRTIRKADNGGSYYSEAWLYEKKDIALVRVAAAVRRLGYI